MSERSGVTRRRFLQGIGVAAAGGAVGGAVGSTIVALPGIALAGAEGGDAAADVEVLGPGPVPVKLSVNGKDHALQAEPRATLLDVLRNDLGVTGPKEVCDRGACGACTVLLDGIAVCACMTLALDADGRKVTTVEGLCEKDGSPGDLQRAFVEKDALQCGFCTPGMVTASAALLAANPSPTAEDVRAGISGKLCRCVTYPRIVEAVIATAALRRKGR